MKRITVNFSDAEYAALEKRNTKGASLSSFIKELINAAKAQHTPQTSENNTPDISATLDAIREEIAALKQNAAEVQHKKKPPLTSLEATLEEIRKNSKLIPQLAKTSTLNNNHAALVHLFTTQQVWFEEFEEFLKGKKFKIK